MDEFDEILFDLENNGQTSKTLKYLKKRADNALRNFYDPSYNGIRSKMIKKFKRTISAIKRKAKQIS